MQLLSHPRQIRLHYPPAYHADLVTPRGDRSKLGTISTAQIHFAASKQHTLTIVNGYTQFQYGRGKKHTDYQAIRSVFQTVKQRFSGKRIAYPKIGCGLGGGDWKEVTHIIDEVLLGEDHTYVEFEPGEIKTRKRKPLHTTLRGGCTDVSRSQAPPGDVLSTGGRSHQNNQTRACHKKTKKEASPVQSSTVGKEPDPPCSSQNEDDMSGRTRTTSIS